MKFVFAALAVFAAAIGVENWAATQDEMADVVVVSSFQTMPDTGSLLAPAPETETALPGDDNGDGVIDEDESGWDCSTMGNGICGSEEE
ncbi:hypothetical protein [Segniliparus rugosus]|uniref:Uncharacterized protein n=1 Tax=Segniliparus rugosus (strain ATCC BAA-974 / DSM 45345 / CCUG 50838 / CIP 108380 / JCM 13579 / CDC 945) TaxID=679197 RepID=E5XRU5_SEGRC|nr:hypothetical protein [Segniliparus rugosus]EFV12960.1 hypothetical protein HMPREF9336_02217 [Segniliparus rugosus ATCC BAA-974]